MKHQHAQIQHQTLAFIAHMFVAGIVAEAFAQDAKEFLWASQLGGSKSQTGYGMTVDQAGNIYVTGIAGNKSYQSIGTHLWHSSGGDVFLAKFSPAGKLLWRQNAGGSGVAAGIGVAVDKALGVYVAGYFAGKIKFGEVKLQAAEDKKTHDYSPADAFLARYSSDGKLLWVHQAGGTSLDQIYGVSTDQEGNAYVTGYFQGKATFGSMTLKSRTQPDGYHDPDTRYGDIFVAKYDSSGNLSWVRQAGEIGLNVGHNIAADAAGNVYVTGRFEGGKISFDKILVAHTNLCNFVAKYDRDGNVLWAQPTAGVGDLDYAKNSIAVDSSNHVFVAGSFIFTQTISSITLTELPGGNKDVFLAKYDSDGKVLWCKQAGGKSHDTCEGLALDGPGNAYITGSFDEDARFGSVQIRAKDHDPRVSGYESFIACYDPDGEVAWVNAPHIGTWVKGIALDNHDHVCVTGAVRDSITIGKTALKSGKDFWGEQIGDVFIAKLRKN